MNWFSRKKKIALVDTIIILIIIMWILFLSSHSPESIINSIGVTNGYLFAFLFSILGGMTTFTFISVYPAVITLAIGGLHPLIIGFISGVGLTIANASFFYFGLKGRNIAQTSSKFSKYSESILNWLNKRPEWFMPIFIWFYVGLTPLPNNFLTASGGLLDYSFKKIIIPLFIGNITLMILMGYLTIVGIGLFK